MLSSVERQASLDPLACIQQSFIQQLCVLVQTLSFPELQFSAICGFIDGLLCNLDCAVSRDPPRASASLVLGFWIFLTTRRLTRILYPVRHDRPPRLFFPSLSDKVLE